MIRETDGESMMIIIKGVREGMEEGEYMVKECIEKVVLVTSPSLS